MKSLRPEIPIITMAIGIRFTDNATNILNSFIEKHEMIEKRYIRSG